MFKHIYYLRFQSQIDGKVGFNWQVIELRPWDSLIEAITHFMESCEELGHSELNLLDLRRIK